MLVAWSLSQWHDRRPRQWISLEAGARDLGKDGVRLKKVGKLSVEAGAEVDEVALIPTALQLVDRLPANFWMNFVRQRVGTGP